MKELILVIVAALLAGCAAQPKSQDEINVDNELRGLQAYHVPAKPATPEQWVGAAAASIQSKFYDVDTYKGRVCDLVINTDDEGKVLAIRAQSGDPALCEAAISATKRAKFPPLPENMPHEIPFRFAPK